MSQFHDLNVNLLSPAKTLAQVKARHVNIPGVLGYLGVMPGHAPMITELSSGLLTIEATGGAKTQYRITGGFAEVIGDDLTLLVDSAELAN